MADSINNNYSGIYQNIFSSDRKVVFKDFKTLWEHLGGKLRPSGKGGSHKILFYKGKKMGSTYRPHPVPTYDFKSKKFLRKALNNMEDALRQGQ